MNNNNMFMGKITEFRIIKGISLYTNNLKAYNKYLKRVNNRNRLYNKLKMKGRKL